jgi:hypothetical protein
VTVTGSFLLGCVSSCGAGYIGLWVAVRYKPHSFSFSKTCFSFYFRSAETFAAHDVFTLFYFNLWGGLHRLVGRRAVRGSLSMYAMMRHVCYHKNNNIFEFAGF